MTQEIKKIKIKDLVLWTENPRDPIDSNAKDQDIVDKAIENKLSKWDLSKLSAEMGEFYDFSEIPTVVYKDSKPVVYDGNRRIILGKIKKGLVKTEEKKTLNLPDFPDEIPCNVCDEKTALTNIYRKHAESGSWKPLERDIFVNKFMQEKKSVFLIIEECTGIITANPHLNQRYVKDEVFKEENLKKMGFCIEKGKLKSKHTNEEAKEILLNISQLIKDKEITTRGENRGKVFDLLNGNSKDLIEKNKKSPLKEVNLPSRGYDERNGSKSSQNRKTKVTKKNDSKIFGKDLFLEKGDVNNLYRAICSMYDFYIKNKQSLSDLFPCLIRMSLRLLSETAGKDKGHVKIDNYFNKYFDDAKKRLNVNDKTTLSNNSVKKESIIQLIQTGAHNYAASKNIDQTMAISIILGEILSLSHGKKKQ